MKAFILCAAAAAVLTGCGGGGGGSTPASTTTSSTTNTAPAVKCTYPEAGNTMQLQIRSTAGEQDITDTSKRLNILITGTSNDMKLGPCVYVESLAISGTSNEVKSDASSRIGAVIFNAESTSNLVWTNTASNTTVSDLGTSNRVNRD